LNKLVKNNYFFCATEQSGDNLGAKIINEIKLGKNNHNFDGVGGSKMNKLFNKQYFSLKDFKSIGIFEIVGSIGKYLKMIENLTKIILKNNYKIVITIDSPDFNYRLAKNIKKKGYKGKIIHIVAPSVWAWRKNRAKDFALVFDKLLVIFPFEVKYFRKYKLKTTFIGNPIYYIKHYNKKINKKYIAFLPGSRIGEVRVLIKYFKIISDYLYKISSDYKIFIPTLPHLIDELVLLTSDWKRKPILEISHVKIENYFLQTLLSVVCSGTASLEIAKRKIPHIIIYKLNFFTTFIILLFTYIKYANIINIMANKMIIPEIINFRLNRKNILTEFKKLFNNHNNNNDKQIINSKKFIDSLVLNKSPATMASTEIRKLLFPKPLKY